jgi:hypothetical protein
MVRGRGATQVDGMARGGLKMGDGRFENLRSVSPLDVLGLALLIIFLPQLFFVFIFLSFFQSFSAA